MSLQINRRGVLRAADTFLSPFQQSFPALCVLLAEACCHFAPPTCILLFFLNLASKSHQLLITAYTVYTNRIQREFDSNVAIATFEFLLASKPSRQKTNLFKLLALFLCASALSFYLLFFADLLHPNRIQREFLFNNCIHSQKYSSASKQSRQKTNLLKQRRAVTSRRRHFAFSPIAYLR
jgi:hypothetical protein